jgi:hypothetical protein
VRVGVIVGVGVRVGQTELNNKLPDESASITIPLKL